MKPSVQPERFRVVELANGAFSVHANAYGEIMHPGLGPAAEADLLYVQQLRIPERMSAGTGEFVIWDIGLGAAANAIAVLRATREISRPLRLVSFDNTAEPLAFALANAESLGYLCGYKAQVEMLLSHRQVQFTNGASAVSWEFHLGDFPTWLERRALARPVPESEPRQAEPALGAPHAVLFDAFSPAKNPAMWTLPLFTNLFRALDPQRPCNLTTYSRSTMFRVTLLLTGFFVGRGVATGTKEETTVAANTPDLIHAPLDRQWLERARRSDSAEPLHKPEYSRGPLSVDSAQKLQSHFQFRM